MTPEEEAYEEALRRIREAEETRTVYVDLSELSELTRLPPELERLTSLARSHRGAMQQADLQSGLSQPYLPRLTCGTIGPSPSTDSGDSGAASKARLSRFYTRFGFVPNEGRNKDSRSASP